MEANGRNFVSLEDLTKESSNCVATIAVLKALFTKLPTHTDPKQLFRDTKKKLAGTPSAHCLPDVMAAFQTACHA